MADLVVVEDEEAATGGTDGPGFEEDELVVGSAGRRIGGGPGGGPGAGPGGPTMTSLRYDTIG